MMSLSDWRKGIVDLTLESDNEDDSPTSSVPGHQLPPIVPLPGSNRPSNISTPTAHMKNPSVPLPGSTPRIPHQNHHTFAKHIYTSNDTRNGASEKRRKLSAHGAASTRPLAPSPVTESLSNASVQQSNGTSYRRGSDYAPHAQPGPAPSRLSNRSSATSMAGKPPSVQHMNAALKTNGGTPSLVGSVARNEPRPLHIGRMPSSGAFELPRSSSLTTPGTASTTPTGPVPSFYRRERMMERKPEPAYGSQGGGTRMPQAIPRAGVQAQPPAQATQLEMSKSRSQQPSTSYIPGAAPTFQGCDEYSAMSGGSLPVTREHNLASTNGTKTSQQPPYVPFSETVAPKPIPSRAPGQFSEEEEHLLIFLKEVKKFKWALITSEFNRDIPGRPYPTLQSRYSTKTNRRDRSQDPAVLKLPPRWAAEAVIDWAAVHAETPGPRERVEAVNLYREAKPAPVVAPKPTIFHQTTEQDYSSGTDSGVRQQRPRRAPPVNYDVRKRNRRLGEDMDGAEVDDVIPFADVDMDMDTPMQSESPSQAQAAIPATAHVVINEPLEMHFTADDASIGLMARRGALDLASQKLPYLAYSARTMLQNPPEDFNWDQLTSREWQGSLLHVDFSPEELKQAQRAVSRICTPQASRHSTRRQHMRTLLKDVSEPKLLRLARVIQRCLPARDSSSVNAFLDDARAGKLAESPRILRLSAARPQKSNSSIHVESTSSMLRHREIGAHSRRGWKAAAKPLTYQTRNKLVDTLGPQYSWTGASSDIHTVAWSQDGERFAAGAVAVTDRDSMQYNRANNLLLGNLADNTIHELAEHRIKRAKTDAGANSTHAMFVSQDPKLYTTVTSVAFSPSGKLMYSSGYDESVCLWYLDPTPSQPALGAKLKHASEVEMMVVNNHIEGMLATAAKRTAGAAIKLITFDEDDPSEPQKHNFHSEKAVSRSDLRILPQALQFEPRCGGLLLAGFGANVRNDTAFDITGDLCIWDIATQAQIPIHGSNRNVFDVAFNPNRRYMPLFAAGCVASTNVNRGTRSVIRLYDEKGLDKYTCPLEIECRALDMNDVVWCPQDEHLIAAGCTDGRVYVWDMRSPEDPLMTLSHGHSLMPLQDGIHHERTDTGIRFLSWGDNSTRLYSGSSDGVVKVWDVTRSAEDTFIKDLITLDSGIMAGAFSPDFSKLVLGEVNGSVAILDVGRNDCSIKEAEKLRYMPYAGETRDRDPTATDSGVAGAMHLLQTQQLQVVAMSNPPIRQVVQGPSYQGPFDQSVDAPFLREQALEFQLSMSTAPGPQCSIAACANNIITITGEEIGDSGRSSDRIPDELRKQWTSLDPRARIIAGKSKCTHCTRPARPSPSGTNDPDAPVLCERCSFACFRCGAVNPIAPATTTLTCDTCAGVWEIGALGYECVEQPVLRKFELDVPTLRRYGRDMLLEWGEDGETSFGDEVNALTEYYFSLAIDRPESPPL
ncbi:hypothetical protein CC86DRAFT_323422 [Ophiobolus disseminans]|uniref:Uncharacterized protein n=1 Tax=Ophiobolus disseminans TaxID=1469910 RepID=A0A6A7A0F3_9PLEO|nr:hypothetical protein CC86DRAFT_323422 [Ophiobolus disseminans]